MAIAVNVGDDHSGRRHLRVQSLALPLQAGGVRRVVDIEARSRAAKPCHDFIIAIAIEVSAQQRVAVAEAIVNRVAAPQITRLTSGINNHVLAMPGLDGSQETTAVQPANADFARPATGS